MSQLFPIAPLEKITDKDCQELSKCLWKWQLCGNCSGKEACTNQSCPWNRKDMVRSYLARYARLTSSYVPEYFAARQALSRHKDLLDIMQLVKGNPDKTKSWMMQQVFKTAIDPKCTRGCRSGTGFQPGGKRLVVSELWYVRWLCRPDRRLYLITPLELGSVN